VTRVLSPSSSSADEYKASGKKEGFRRYAHPVGSPAKTGGTVFVRPLSLVFACVLSAAPLTAMADQQYPITVVNTPETHIQFLSGYISGSRGSLYFCYTVTIADGAKIDGFRTRAKYLKFDGQPVKIAPLYATQESNQVHLEPLKDGTGPAQGVYSDCWLSPRLARDLGIEVSQGATFTVTSLHYAGQRDWVDVSIPADTPGVTLPRKLTP